MSPKSPEFVDFENNTFVNIPLLSDIIVGPLSIQKRLLGGAFAPEHLRGKTKQINEFFLRVQHPDDENPRKIFDHGNDFAAEILVATRNDFENDLQDIAGKIYFYFENLQFTTQEIESLKPSVLAIYQQVVERGLVEIEAQIDQQIVTLANNIMLRRLTDRTRKSAMDVLKS